MRKIICFAVSLIVLINFGNAQSVQGTLLQGTASNRVIFAIQASSNFSAAITNVQFTLQIPNTITPIPSVTIHNNLLATNIPVYNNNTVNSTTPIAFTNEGGFYNYLFSATVTGGPSFNFTTSTTNVLEVEINGAQGATTVRFASLASGGSSGQHYFYVEAAGVDRTNEAAMFFGVGFVNSGSYNSYSYVPLSNATLPVQFSQFTAQCNNKGALLTWKTASEQNSNRFEIQRSTNYKIKNLL